MSKLEEKIKYEIEWRTDEISVLKTIPFLYPFTRKQKEILKKYVIPNLYSLWEGFVVELFSIYVREINQLKLSIDQINENILVHSIDIVYDLKRPLTDFAKQKEFIRNFQDFLKKEVEIPLKIPTESNIKYKVINRILTHFNLETLPLNMEKPLNRLMLFRNGLAHGQNSIPINQEIIDELSLTVITSMHMVAERVLDGFVNKSYLAVISRS